MKVIYEDFDSYEERSLQEARIAKEKADIARELLAVAILKSYELPDDFISVSKTFSDESLKTAFKDLFNKEIEIIPPGDRGNWKICKIL